MREVRPAVLVRESSTQFVNMHQILYLYTNFQVSERLHEGPEFSHYYLIDYTIGFIIHYTTIIS